MSEAAAMQSKPIAMRGNSSDQPVLAQVEKRADLRGMSVRAPNVR